MRSWLTVLSILIGISAIYALISFGQGLSLYVNELAEESGVDKIIIQAEGAGTIPDDEFAITRNDLEFVEKINGIDEAAGLYFNVVEVEIDDLKRFVFVSSMPPGKEVEMVEESFAIEVIEGRALRPNDNFKAVLGYNYQFEDKVFPDPVKIRDRIDINGIKFEVVGFYDEVGNPQDDSNIYIPETAYEQLLPEKKDKFQIVIARAAATENPEQLAERVKDKLRRFKGQEEGKEDFFVQTFAQAIETFGNVIVVINAVLVLIALISVIVAGVNIMNTMYTSVLERTKEIGIMKSIGATNANILTIFLLESGMLGLVGGLLGVAVGWMIASAGGAFAASAGFSFLQPIFPWQLTVGSLLFAFLVGAGAGLLPAVQAAKLKPVDALRYE